MLKLYRKNELAFALVWIGVYVVGASAADALSDALGVQKSVSFPFLLALSLLALIWLKKNALFVKYGLVKSPVAPKRFLYYIPLLILISCNLWGGVALNMSYTQTALYALSMLCVGFLEELIFRGFLFEAMRKNGVRSAIIVSSITFGIGHIVNLINGSGAELIPNLCQVFYATAFGFLCVILFWRGKSLLPCIVTHSLFNALSVFADPKNVTVQRQIVVSIVLCAGTVLYIFALLRTLPAAEQAQ